MNGRSTARVTVFEGIAEVSIVTAVAVAASVPFSSTSMFARCTTR